MTSENLARMPYPIASIYLYLDDAEASWQTKREAVFFTGYQLMRSLALPLVGQYFTQDLPEGASRKHVDNFNAKIADIHRPFYSSWIALLNSLALRHVDLNLDFFDEFGAAMKAVKTETIDLPPEKTQYHIRKDGRENCWQNLTRFEALLGLRNSTAHCGMASDDVCRDAVNIFRPILDDLLGIFAFLQNDDQFTVRRDILRQLKAENRLPDAKIANYLTYLEKNLTADESNLEENSKADESKWSVKLLIRKLFNFN